MTSPTAEKHEKSKQSDTKDWPELAPIHASLTPAQALANETVKIQGENARKLLILQSKTLLAATVLVFLSVAQSAFHVIPAILRGEVGLITLLFALNMVLELAASAYFLRARDSETSAQVLKLLIIVNSLVLLMGFARPSSLPLLLATIVLMLSAYERMKQLKYGGE